MGFIKGAEMDAGYLTPRNLLWWVWTLVVLAVLSIFYVVTQLSRNSDELTELRLMLQKRGLTVPWP